MTGLDMKSQHIKSARHIFRQCQKAKSLPKEATFQAEMMDINDINDDSRYNGGFVFVPSIAEHICHTGRATTTTDAAHCDGVGPQSYGTTFGVLGYDCNSHLVLTLFAHHVGAECLETWALVLETCSKISGFEVERRTTNVS